MSLQTRFDQLELEISTMRNSNKEWILANPCDIEEEYMLFDLPITLDSFQDGTHWSKCRNPDTMPMDVYYAIGLAGETGELLNYVKKQHRNDKGEVTEKRREQIIGEVGDILYYLSAFAKEHDILLSEVAKVNQKKMLVRLKEWKEKNAAHLHRD